MNQMIFVAPLGNDQSSGAFDSPVATLARAQHLARDARQIGHSVEIILRGGVHRLAQTLVLTHADSGTPTAPVCWQAAEGESAIISGGELLSLDWQPYRDGILQARVAADFKTDQIFVNGQRQQMARYPNYDPNQRIMNGYSADCISPERAARWADPAGGYIHAMHSHLWGDYHYLITGKNADGTLRYEGGWQNNRQMGMHKEYRYVENILEELDVPGEWYHDTETKTLYLYPPDGINLAEATVESVRLRHLVELRGSEADPVSYVQLRGLTFSHAARTFMENREPMVRSDWTMYRGGAIRLEGTENCAIEACSIDQVGGNAIFFNNYNRRAVVRGCRISDAGANGVTFVGDPNAARSPLFEYNQTQPYEAMDKMRGPKTDNYPADCLVEDCLIYRSGRVEKQTAPVQIELSARITIRHCSIYDVPRAGINIGDGCWGGHVIEFCDVFDTVKETGDHGSFNSWGRDRYWLPGIKDVDALVKAHPELPTLDCIEPITIRNSRWRCDHGWDIDLDDGASYYLIYNNLCLNGGIKNREGYGRIVEDNILVNNSFHPHVWFANSGDVFRRNIVFTPYQPIGVDKPWGQEVDWNLLHQGGAVRPALELQEQSGRDEHSIVGDALFVDSGSGDYRIREDSSAFQIGFRNFPMDRFGVTSPSLRQLARTPDLPNTDVGSSDETGGQIAIWRGAVVKRVTTLGEISATGVAGAGGVMLLSVPIGSHALWCGLQPNDVIYECGSAEIDTVKDLVNATAGPRGKMTLMLWRQQNRIAHECEL